jgi:hypothetical protein
MIIDQAVTGHSASVGERGGGCHRAHPALLINRQLVHLEYEAVVVHCDQSTTVLGGAP